MARIGIIGSAGRMGQALTEAIAAAGHERSGGIDQGGDALALAQASDVLVDFSAPDALEFNLEAAIHAGVPIVVGTTGLAERHHWLVDAAAVEYSGAADGQHLARRDLARASGVRGGHAAGRRLGYRDHRDDTTA